MRTRTLALEGWRAALVLGLFVIAAIGVIALLLMVGTVMAVVGLGLSAAGALYYAVRRKLASVSKTDDWGIENPAPAHVALEVREIEVEVLPQKES